MLINDFSMKNLERRAVFSQQGIDFYRIVDGDFVGIVINKLASAAFVEETVGCVIWLRLLVEFENDIIGRFRKDSRRDNAIGEGVLHSSLCLREIKVFFFKDFDIGSLYNEIAHLKN